MAIIQLEEKEFWMKFEQIFGFTNPPITNLHISIGECIEGKEVRYIMKNSEIDIEKWKEIFSEA